MIRFFLIVQVADASDKRRVPLTFCPVDGCSLSASSGEHVIHVIFDYLVVDTAPFRATLGTAHQWTNSTLLCPGFAPEGGTRSYLHPKTVAMRV